MTHEANNPAGLRKTPLYPEHISRGAKMSPFGGWFMPIQYDGILVEHAHTRNEVSVFDICHMGEFILDGDPVLSGLDRIVTQSIVSMPQGSCRYGFMLDPHGGVLDDLVVYRMKKDSWMLVVNAATIASDEEHLRKNLSLNCNIQNVSENLGKLDIQGPKSMDLLKGLFGRGVSELAYYTFAEFTFGKERCIISRTGYTGELGYEIYVPAARVKDLWEAILKDKRTKPAGLGCRDTLRLEVGYPLYGQDLDLEHTPIAAGFSKFVDFSKDFIGREVLLLELKNGPKERLICFRSETRRAIRHGFAIFDQDKPVGTVTSGSFSPSLCVSIGMGYVSGNYKAGDKLLIKDGLTQIPVEIVNKPIYHKPSV